MKIHSPREIPTWPQDTEYMISRALSFKKDLGDK